MNNQVKVGIVVVAVFLVAFLIGWGLVGSILSWGAGNASDFVTEQQPGVKSAGELIGKQYSQLRELSVALDTISCKVQINESGQKVLLDTYAAEKDPLKWPDDARQEYSNLRWEHDTLLMSYAQVAGQYNDLRTDIRTIADNLGLEVDEIPKAEAQSPIPGMCNGFALPELE
jgi:hypothetical protein